MTLITDFIAKVTAYVTSPYFWTGAVIAAALVLLLEFLLWLVLKLRRQVKDIVVHDENGEFTISSKAFRNFLQNSVQEIGGIRLKDVSLRKGSGGRLRVDLMLALDASADLPAIHSRLKTKILTEAKNKLGIEESLECINMTFAKLPAPEALDESGDAR